MQSVVANAYNPCIQEARGNKISIGEASLGYLMSLRLAWAAVWDTI